MKRLIYMSSFSAPLSDKDIEILGRDANARNNNRGITGVLLCLNNNFFQILEGEKAIIDGLFETIKKDPRHKDVVCLINEDHVYDRLFPGRYMHTVNLNVNNSMFFQPVKVLLQQLIQSHRIIGKYTQPAVMNKLLQGLDPLALEPQRTVNAVLFADMIGFSVISERFFVDDVVRLINFYLETVTNAVSEFGGEVTKYIGDCVMAHFNEGEVDNALKAAVQIQETLGLVRSNACLDAPERLLYSGIGIEYGEVIQGNVGSNIKMDYTLVGSVVNRAQGLERLTRVLPAGLIFSEEVKNASKSDWNFVELGKHTVKGRTEPADIFTLDHPAVYPLENPQGK